MQPERNFVADVVITKPRRQATNTLTRPTTNSGTVACNTTPRKAAAAQFFIIKTQVDFKYPKLNQAGISPAVV